MKKIFRQATQLCRFLMTVAAVFCCTLSVSAQEGRNRTYNIKLGTMQYVHHDEKMSTGEAVGKILTGIATGNTSVEAVKYEADVKSAIAHGLSGAYRYRFGNVEGHATPEEGDLVADALITNIHALSSTKTYKDGDDKTKTVTYYTGVVEVMLTLKDAVTGAVVATPTFSGRGSSNSTFSTTEQAIKDAIGRLSQHITTWLNQRLPLQANIIEGAAAKKDKQKEVYIDLGRLEGAVAGLHMGVFLVKTVAGKEAKMQIGKLKIEAVEGDEISRCKVQSGGKEIKAALEAGADLRVMTIDK